MDNRLKAALWMGGAIASFSMMAVGGRETAGKLPIFELLTLRTAVGLVIVAALLSVVGWHHARPKKLALLALRNVSHFGATFCWFLGVSLLPLAQVFAIEFTTPIWVALMAVVFLNERLSRLRMLAIALGFVGILIVVRPGLGVFQPASLVVLTAAFGFAISVVVTKAQLKSISVYGFMFWMMVMQLPLGIAVTTFGPGWVMPPSETWIWIIAVGIAGFSAHFCLANALNNADALFVTPIDFLRLPVILVVGAVLYGERVEFWVLAGAALIMSGVLVTVIEGRRAR